MQNRYDGTQIDYEDYLVYKERQKSFDPYSTTSSDLYKKKKAEQESEIMSSIVSTVGAGAALAAVGNYVNNNPTALSLINRLPGSDVLNNRLLSNNILNNPFEGIETGFSRNSVRPVSNILQTALLNLEELSPLHILKTLQLSSFTSIFTTLADNTKDIRISSDVINNYQDYFTKLIASEGNRSLTNNDLRYGLVLRDGRLYGVTADGLVNINDVVMNKARIVHSSLDIGGNRSPNRIFEKYSDIYGAKFSKKASDTANLVIVGAKDNATLMTNWFRAYGRYAMEIGYKTLDNPLAGVEELLDVAGVGTTRLVNNKYYKFIRDRLNISLGTKGAYDLSTRESLKIVGKNIATKSAAIYLGYNFLNGVLNNITSENNPYNQGLISGLAANYANIRVGAAQLWSDNFQAYKKAQEEAAPESTSLTTLLGLPAAGALLGGNIAFMQRMYHTQKHGMIAAANYFEAERSYGSDRLLNYIGLAKNEKILKRYTKIGALVGAGLALPYLPGALIGESSDELKKKYSGEKEVAIRANRFWLAGGTAYKGEDIKYYRQHAVAQLISNARNKTYYENMDQKRDFDPLYSPLRYLKNPYAFEEKTKETMPYPVWGMNVTYGSFFGEAFQGTFGQVIKPTVINKEFIKNNIISKKSIIEAESKIVANMLGIDKATNKDSVTEDSDNKSVGAYRQYQIEQAKLTSGNRSIFSEGSGDYVTQTDEKRVDRSLIMTGDMLKKESAEIDPLKITASASYVALTDFTGLKGFSSGLLLGSVGIDPTEYKKQLAISGNATTAQSQIQNMELGDMLGMGEFQRRIVPTSAASKKEYINPMKNKMPSWLPSDESKYYLDFSTGNPYDKVINGAVRLPGRGFEALNPDVKNLDPEKYPLVYQYKILSDVAGGSPEQISLRNYLLKNKDKLSEREQNIFFTSLQQEQAKKEKRQFYEYGKDANKENYSILQEIQNSLWNTIAHKSESVLEPLTPFRPAAKFIHQRTAIEDYIKTQLHGSDVGIWTNPYSHFIKPAMNRVYGLLPGIQKSKESLEKERVDEYFDKLSFLKAMRNGDINSAKKTVIGASYLGITDKNSYDKFRAALPENQRIYLEAFSKEKDPEKRKQILALLPTDVRQAYSSIWSNIDIANKAKADGRDPLKAIKDNYYKDTSILQKTFGVTLNNADMQRIKVNAEKYTDKTSKLEYIESKKAETIRLRAAEKQASEYVSNQTGMPSNNWVGWDPRLTSSDIKLRTLSIGKEDIHKYGFWKSDLERNERLTVLDSNKEITRDFDKIRQELKSQQNRKFEIERKLRANGFNTSKIDFIPAAQNDVRIRDIQ
jgi:hypothetical protein